MKLLHFENTQPQITTTGKAKIGDLMVVIEGANEGIVFLKTFSCFVSLEDPNKTWNSDPNFKVRIFNKGEGVTLIQE